MYPLKRVPPVAGPVREWFDGLTIRPEPRRRANTPPGARTGPKRVQRDTRVTPSGGRTRA